MRNDILRLRKKKHCLSHDFYRKIYFGNNVVDAKGENASINCSHCCAEVNNLDSW